MTIILYIASHSHYNTCCTVSVSLVSLDEICVFRPEEEYGELGESRKHTHGVHHRAHTGHAHSLISGVEEIDVLIIVAAQQLCMWRHNQQ